MSVISNPTDKSKSRCSSDMPQKPIFDSIVFPTILEEGAERFSFCFVLVVDEDEGPPEATEIEDVLLLDILRVDLIRFMPPSDPLPGLVRRLALRVLD